MQFGRTSTRRRQTLSSTNCSGRGGRTCAWQAARPAPSACARARSTWTPLGTVAGFGSVPPWRCGRVRAVLIGGGGRGAPGGARRGRSHHSAGDAAPLPLHAGCWSRPTAAATSHVASLEKIAGKKVAGNLPCGVRRRKTRDREDTRTGRARIFARVGPFFSES